MASNEIVERYQTKVFSIIYASSNRNDARISRSRFLPDLLFDQEFRLSQLAADVDYKITVNECSTICAIAVRKLVYERFFERRFAAMENSDPATSFSPVDKRLAAHLISSSL